MANEIAGLALIVVVMAIMIYAGLYMAQRNICDKLDEVIQAIERLSEGE